MTPSPAYQEWVDDARAVLVEQAAGLVGARLRRAGRELAGPCPACGGKRDKLSVNPSKRVFNCGHAGGAGGDAIALVQHVEGCDFNKACEILTGRPKPGAEPETEAERQARAHARAAREQRLALDAQRQEGIRNEYREAERRRSYIIWSNGYAFGDTPLERYFAHRRITPPAGAHLRFGASVPYYVADIDPKKPARRLFEGPAMLAAITDSGGVFRGVHITWLDPRLIAGELPADSSGKRSIVDPGSGEVLPSKKVRGSAGGNRIVLVSATDPHTLYTGEGIETTLSVRDALVEGGVPLDGCAFWAGISLGNLAGKAVHRVRHPSERRFGTGGRDLGALRVPGAEPDLASTAMRVPDSVETLFLLGDGDSEPFTTRLALERGAARHARRPDGRERQVFIPMAPAGTDFNKLRMEAA